MFIFILIIIFVVLFFIFKRSKNLYLNYILMINGSNGTGKSALSFSEGNKAINKAHRIWWRRTHLWCHLPFCKKMKYEQHPLIYCNIPFKHKYYAPLTLSILLREERPIYHSVIVIDESSLLATSLDYKDKDLSEKLQLFLKLIRHEMRGSYRNLLGSYPGVIINTQSKNDNHFAFDRCINQVLYITKVKTIPFFKILYCRDLLLIDSVVNEFNDDIKEDISSRWFLVPKKIFKKYDSYAYEFLTRNLNVVDVNDEYKLLDPKNVNRFYIPTFHFWKEFSISNNSLKDILIEFNLKEVDSNEK